MKLTQGAGVTLSDTIRKLLKSAPSRCLAVIFETKTLPPSPSARGGWLFAPRSAVTDLCAQAQMHTVPIILDVQHGPDKEVLYPLLYILLEMTSLAQQGHARVIGSL